MKVIKSSVDIIEQEPGIIGMFKHIERVGRISYKSEDKMTADSYLRFVEMLRKRGHWAVFNLGTVYLTVQKDKIDQASTISVESVTTVPYTRYREDDEAYYITTNYRVICQLGLEDFMKKFWSEPGVYHYRRVTSHWICSRSTSHQLVRHRQFSVIQESQRYINYELVKNGGGITYIIPQWAYQFKRPVDENLSGLDLWRSLLSISPLVYHRNKVWQMLEDAYAESIEEGQKPEDARGILCNDTKTELCCTAYLEDYVAEPDPRETSEKYGFFYLRCAPDAQADIRVLAEDLKKQFIEKGLIKTN